MKKDFIGKLRLGDVIVYSIEGEEIHIKVINIIEKYQRYIVELNGKRHNLSTVLKKYGRSNIVRIISES